MVWLTAAVPAPAQSHAYMVAASDGYGVQECLTNGDQDCGKVVADAWCETHGQGSAISFGPAEDVTGSTNRPDDSSGAAVITCSE